MPRYTYTCIADCEHPVDPRGVRLNDDGSGDYVSLHHYFRAGDELRNPDLFDPLPTPDSAEKGPHAVVNRNFACSDPEIEAQRQELWKRMDGDADLREQEEMLKRQRNTPTMHLLEQYAQMNADSIAKSINALAAINQPKAPEPDEPAREEAPKKEHWTARKKREAQPTGVAE